MGDPINFNYNHTSVKVKHFSEFYRNLNYSDCYAPTTKGTQRPTRASIESNIIQNMSRESLMEIAPAVQQLSKQASISASTMHFALGVMQNVATFSDNEDIQNFITRSMEELVERSINTRLFMLPRNDGTQTGQEALQSIQAERNAFRSNLTEMFETLRAQMLSGERQFPLVQSFDVSV